MYDYSRLESWARAERVLLAFRFRVVESLLARMRK
jgi:hypothetical protein